MGLAAFPTRLPFRASDIFFLTSMVGGVRRTLLYNAEHVCEQKTFGSKGIALKTALHSSRLHCLVAAIVFK